MRVIVTHLADGDGGSTVAANLAVMMAETGMNIAFVDGDSEKQTGYTLLNPEATPAVFADSQAPIIHGDAWGIDCYAISSNGSQWKLRSDIFRKLNRTLKRAFIVCDVPGPLLKETNRIAAGDSVLVLVATPESLATDKGQRSLQRYRRLQPHLYLILNKCPQSYDCREHSSVLNGITMVEHLPFDRRVADCGEQGLLPIEQIPDYRPVFARLALNISGPLGRGALSTAASAAFTRPMVSGN